MSLGQQWVETPEWVRMQLDQLLLKQAITLPVDEFNFFSRMVIKRLATVKRLYTVDGECNRPFINNPMLEFIGYVLHNLAPEQKAGIVAADTVGGIEWFEREVKVHPAVVESWSNPEQCSVVPTKEWVMHIHNLPLSRVIRITPEEGIKVFKQFYLDHPELPRYATV